MAIIIAKNYLSIYFSNIHHTSHLKWAPYLSRDIDKPNSGGGCGIIKKGWIGGYLEISVD